MAPQAYKRISPVEQSGGQTIFEAPSTGIPSSPPPSFHSRNDNASQHEHDPLVDAFEGSSDSELDDDEDDWDDRQIVQSQPAPRAGFFGGSSDQYQALQENRPTSDSSANTETSPTDSASNPVAVQAGPARGRTPAQGGFFGIRLPWGNSRTSQLTRANQNDGVFANITAKPETDRPSEDFPPTYEEAAADQTPPYWETTIMAPGFGDEVFIEGLPVGSPINFIWNMMVSSAFQFVGFLLTYLLHTSHAAKQGSRAGLGFTLFQYGFYLQPNAAGDASAPAKEFEPSQPNNYDVNAKSQDMSGSFNQGSSSDGDASASLDASTASGWISVLLMVLGAIMILKAVADYLRARKMELVIQGPSPPAVIEQEGSAQAMV